MIILRKPKAPSSIIILAEEPAGAINGLNQTYSTEYIYRSSRIEVIYNGQVLHSPDDFEESGPQEFRLKNVYPDNTDELRVNYEVDSCNADPSSHNSLPHFFTQLVDTPSNYNNSGGLYVRVKDDRSGLEFVNVPPTNIVRIGRQNLAQGIPSTAVTFEEPFDSTDYVLITELENTTDACPSLYPTIITEKSTTGFSVDFTGEIDTDNYYLNWQATMSGSNTVSSGTTISGSTYYTYNLDLEQDTTPSLGGDLEIGNHGIVLDTTPSGNFIHGYTIGWSGETSNMVVERNNAGFGCPLYMKSNGKWDQCTAASGTTQMPCAALALEEGTGTKKIMWKGIVRKGSWSWTPGDMLYVSTVAGALTNTIPNSGAWVQPVGIAIKADTIRFDPGFNPGYINS